MEPLDTKEFIDIVSKSFTLNQRRCGVCTQLPMDKICEVTLDILFDRRTLVGMVQQYTPFATRFINEGKVLGEHRFRHHRDKCCKSISVFTNEELRKLGLLQDEAEVLQRLYDLQYEDELKPDIQKTEIRRQRYYNLNIFNNQRKQVQENIALLEQNILPKTMEITYQAQSGSVPTTIDYGLLLREESNLLWRLTKQIDVVLSNLETNIAAAEKAAKGNTTVIQIMNSSITDMEVKFRGMLEAVKSSLDILLPNQQELVKHIMRLLINHVNEGVVPVLEKAKEVLYTEAN